MCIPLIEVSCAANRDGSVANTTEKEQIERQAVLALKGLTERRLTDVAVRGGTHFSRIDEVGGGLLRSFTLCTLCPEPALSEVEGW